LKFRKPLKITSRISSVTNGFVQAIIPSIEPSSEMRREALAVFGMEESDIRCVYCGSKATDWDHLKSLVHRKRPSGYFNDARNLVPACGPCNQSKSGHDWRIWMLGSAKGSPATRGIPDLTLKVEALERFELWAQLERVSLIDLIGEELWHDYWSKLERIEALMFDAQQSALVIRDKLAASHRPR
jgi:hypothetical protein